MGGLGARIAITGGFGFLGWHVACRLRARHGVDAVRIGRETMADPSRLDAALRDVEAVIHLAGVNRAAKPEEVFAGNVAAAGALAGALARVGRPLPVAYANSIQALTDSVYGRAKARAAEIIGGAATGPLCDVVLPNLFGEHGRPQYNSFVATFAHAVGQNEKPMVTADRQMPLLHAQDAAEALIAAVRSGRRSGTIQPAGEPHGVCEVLEQLRRMHETYRRGELPRLDSQFEIDLFNTYRSYRFPAMFPVAPEVHADQRGDLVETVRLHGGRGQSFFSTTRPGHERGNHFHLRKFERFFIVKGTAEIRLRRLLHDEVVTFRISGDRPGFVDMPTLWTHSLRNVGSDELITVFWSDQLLDMDLPDQYPEPVVVGEDA